MKSQKFRTGGILQKRDLALIGIMDVPDRPGVAAAVLTALGDKDINCPFIVHTISAHNLDSIVVCVAQIHLAAALNALQSICDGVGAEAIVHRDDVVILGIFGPHFGERPGIAGVMFSALAAAGIAILAISTSVSTLSCVIDEAQLDDGIQVLQEAFEQP